MVLGSFPVRVRTPYAPPGTNEFATFKDEPNHIYELNEYRHHNWFDFGFTNGSQSPLTDNGRVWRYLTPDPSGVFNYMLRSIIDTTGNNPAVINDGQQWLDWTSHANQNEFWVRFYLKIPLVKVQDWWSIFNVKPAVGVVAGGLNIGTRIDGTMYPYLYSDPNTGNFTAQPASSVAIAADTWTEIIYHYKRSYLSPYDGVQQVWLNGALIIDQQAVKTATAATGMGIGPTNWSSKVEGIINGVQTPGPVAIDFGPLTYANSMLDFIPAPQFYGYSLAAGTVVAQDSFTGLANISINGRSPSPTRLAPTSTWITRAGTWVINGAGQLDRTSAGVGPELVVLNVAPTDVEVSCDITIGANADCGLILREANDGTESWWEFHYDSVNKFALKTMESGSQQATLQAFTGMDLTVGQTYNFRAVAIGKQIQCYLNNALLMTETDAVMNQVKRGVGLREGGSSACVFDNFTVKKAA